MSKPKRSLILGTSPLAWALAEEIRRRPRCGYSIVGVVGEGRKHERDQGAEPFLGTLDELRQIVSTHQPECLIVAMAERRGCFPIDDLLEAQVQRGIKIEAGVEVYERLTGKIALDSLTPSNVIFSDEYRPARLARRLARCVSLCLACVGLLVFLPLFGLLALAIKLDSPGPVFFIQARAGLGGKAFRLIKFRSMHTANRPMSEWERDNGHRITRVGKWLRAFRLDELPQFINVIRGEMNIVGPRPHPISNYELLVLVARNIPQCGVQIPYYSLRWSVPPGITGWAQVRYKYANGLDEEMEKLRYDLYYVKRYSLVLDLQILLETLWVVLKGRPLGMPATARGRAGGRPASEGRGLLPGLPATLESRGEPVSAAGVKRRRVAHVERRIGDKALGETWGPR